MSFRVPKASRRDSRRRSSAAALLIACSSADSGAGGTSGGSGASAGAGAGATTSGGSYQGDYNGCVPGLQREPHVVLGVHRDATRLEVRQAYWARIRQLHPDLAGQDTNAAMVEVNLAYDLLTQGNRARSFDEEEVERASVFDEPEAEPTCIFVDPFACNCSPLDWRQLQGIVAGREEHPEEALQAAGVFFAYGSAVVWVTPAQLEELTAELEAMEASLAIELTGYYIQDCLLRARAANDRMPYSRP